MTDFGNYNVQLLQTLAVIVILLVFKVIIRKTVSKVSGRFYIEPKRLAITKRVMNIIFLSLGVIFIAGIWGLDQKELLFFISSALTVLGIAFFAQWSILSNITAGLILFFSHPIKIGDTIRIFEKDFEIEGKLLDISVFFMYVQTREGKTITIPNTVALQKMISLNG